MFGGEHQSHHLQLPVLMGSFLVLIAKCVFKARHEHQEAVEETEEANQAMENEENLRQQLADAKLEARNAKVEARNAARLAGSFRILPPELERYATMTDAEIYGTDL